MCSSNRTYLFFVLFILCRYVLDVGIAIDTITSSKSIKDPETLRSKDDICRSKCLENCSCVAYSHDTVIGCMSWTGNLLDIQQFSYGGLDLYVRVAHNELAKIWHSIKAARKRSNKAFLLFNKGETSEHPSHKVIEELSQVKLQELLLFDFERVATATNNFHLSNKLGQGGFGPVYKVP
ncbi:G-type lectin S-receptor serine/threonine-protein kinase [Spatholobus suberectus]|nr:G-type lectin S-receptor serine/threonine-protein kinase [Spatholobus suberectus]